MILPHFLYFSYSYPDARSYPSYRPWSKSKTSFSAFASRVISTSSSRITRAYSYSRNIYYSVFSSFYIFNHKELRSYGRKDSRTSVFCRYEIIMPLVPEYRFKGLEL